MERPKYLGTWQGEAVYEVNRVVYEQEASYRGIYFVINDMDFITVYNGNIVAKFDNRAKRFETFSGGRYADYRDRKEKVEEVKVIESKKVEEKVPEPKKVEEKVEISDIDDFIAMNRKIMIEDMIFKGENYVY